MADVVEFRPFPKIPRLERGLTITEKIDGTNAAIGITDDGQMWCQSRNRIITPDDDNMGFARWVADNESTLLELLGPGVHYGEWCGPGIQKNRHQFPNKRFLLFNVDRWAHLDHLADEGLGIVPVLYVGDDPSRINYWFDQLPHERPYRPEGLMIYLHGPGVYVKHPYASGAKGRLAA